MRIHLKRNVIPILLASMLSGCAVAPTASTQPFKLKIGFDTTRVDGPVLPDGTIDYSAALWEKMSAGVTDENNANPLLEKAFADWKEYKAGIKDSGWQLAESNGAAFR